MEDRGSTRRREKGGRDGGVGGSIPDVVGFAGRARVTNRSRLILRHLSSRLSCIISIFCRTAMRAVFKRFAVVTIARRGTHEINSVRTLPCRLRLSSSRLFEAQAREGEHAGLERDGRRIAGGPVWYALRDGTL